MNRIRIILASASPRRRELLAQIGLTFEVIPAAGDEAAVSREPSRLVMELSGGKAAEIFGRLSKERTLGMEDHLVIGADTLVVCNGHVMGKPEDEKKAVEMLSLLQGRTHQVYTGVTLICQKQIQDPVEVSFYEKTDVTMYPMSGEEIRGYVKTGEPMDKAGAYGIQGKCAAFIKEIHGDYNNVVGLPVGRLYQEMKKLLQADQEKLIVQV